MRAMRALAWVALALPEMEAALFFSEYSEGSHLEIHNSGALDVDLSQFALWGSTPTATVTTTKKNQPFPANSLLKAGAAFVFCAPTASPAVLQRCDSFYDFGSSDVCLGGSIVPGEPQDCVTDASIAGCFPDPLLRTGTLVRKSVGELGAADGAGVPGAADPCEWRVSPSTLNYFGLHRDLGQTLRARATTTAAARRAAATTNMPTRQWQPPPTRPKSRTLPVQNSRTLSETDLAEPAPLAPAESPTPALAIATAISPASRRLSPQPFAPSPENAPTPTHAPAPSAPTFVPRPAPTAIRQTDAPPDSDDETVSLPPALRVAEAGYLIETMLSVDLFVYIFHDSAFVHDFSTALARGIAESVGSLTGVSVDLSLADTRRRSLLSCETSMVARITALSSTGEIAKVEAGLVQAVEEGVMEAACKRNALSSSNQLLVNLAAQDTRKAWIIPAPSLLFLSSTRLAGASTWQPTTLVMSEDEVIHTCLNLLPTPITRNEPTPTLQPTIAPSEAYLMETILSVDLFVYIMNDKTFVNDFSTALAHGIADAVEELSGVTVFLELAETRRRRSLLSCETEMVARVTALSTTEDVSRVKAGLVKAVEEGVMDTACKKKALASENELLINLAKLDVEKAWIIPKPSLSFLESTHLAGAPTFQPTVKAKRPDEEEVIYTCLNLLETPTTRAATPTPQPTTRDDAKPTPTTLPTPTPTAVAESETWHLPKKPSKDCAWVSEKTARCARLGQDGAMASAACEACGGDSLAGGDSLTWFKNGNLEKGCAWVAIDAAKRCGAVSAEDVVAASACPESCSLAVRAGDSPSWRKRGNAEKDCHWVAIHPETRCGKFNSENVAAASACAASCA